MFLVMRNQLENFLTVLVDAGLNKLASGMQENSVWDLAETAEPGVAFPGGNYDP